MQIHQVSSSLGPAKPTCIHMAKKTPTLKCAGNCNALPLEPAAIINLVLYDISPSRTNALTQINPPIPKLLLAGHRHPCRSSPLQQHLAALPESGLNATDKPVAWDPEGLLSSAPPTESHFARRARERAAAISSTTAPPQTLQPPAGPPIRPLPKQHNPIEGILASDTTLYDRKALSASLADRYMPVDLDYPGLRIHHLDPPVFTVDDFFTSEECQRMREAALGTGRMIQSKVGAGNVHGDATVAAASARRTSTSVLVDDKLLADHPNLVPSTADLQAKGMILVGGGETDQQTDVNKPWGKAGKLPGPRQYCYEGLQVTQYEQGQYFMEHEDAFPVDLARENGFNRHATLLVYLNNVPKGGETRFDFLNLSLGPSEGRALLFFPSFSDGTPDVRTLHTATTAVDYKIVTQQWIARGFSAVPLLAKKLLQKKNSEVAVAEKLLGINKDKKSKKNKSNTSGGGFGR
jgi:2OG-Fe(II) oxygenase superfamily